MITFAEPVDADVLRIRHEFLQSPGLQLTAAGAARLVHVSVRHASAMLEGLEQEGFLLRTSEGVYRRAYPLMA